MKIRLLLIFISCWLLCNVTETLGQELGQPFIRNYSAKEYNAGSAMFDITQDERGVLLFANSWNVREYDGVTWNDTHLSNQRSAYCIERGDDGLIYVGGHSEFGFLVANEQGKLSYVSLLPKLEQAIENLGRVFKCYQTDLGIVFISQYHVIRWDGKKAKAWNFSEAISGSFYTDQLHINLAGKGLHVFTNGDFSLVNGGAFFQDKFISAGLTFHDQRLLIATGNQGIFISNQATNYSGFNSFPTPLNTHFKEHSITNAIKMTAGTLAFGTYTGGAAILDKEFNLLCFIDKATGLQDDGVLNLFEDKDQILWLSLRDGTSRVEISTPINRWDESAGLHGFVHTIQRFEGTLYTGTSKGIYYLVNHKNGHSEFMKLDGPSNVFFSSYVFEEAGKKQLLFASKNGIYQVKNVAGQPKLSQVFAIPNARSPIIVPANSPSNRIYVTSGAATHILTYSNGKWVNGGIIQGIDGLRRDVFSVDYSGKVWTIAYGDKLTRFDVAKEGDAYVATNKESFGLEDGLPDKQFTGFALFNKDFFLTSERGVYSFDEDKKRFEIAAAYGDQLADYFTGFYFFEEDAKGNLWYYAYQMGDDIWHEVAYKQPDGSYKVDSVSLRRIPVTDSWIEGTYAEPNGTIWFGGTWGLYKYDDSQMWSSPGSFDALVRKITTGDDSLIFHGAFAQDIKMSDHHKVGVKQNPNRKVTIPYTANSLIFHFASNSFFDESANEYSYKLEGSGTESWSHWEKETKEHIQNLSEGDYVFRVKARNIYGIVSNEATYTFTILPPWYRTNLAFALYALAVILVVWFIVRFNTFRLRRQKEQLELVVENRTKEIQEQAAALKQVNEEITTANEEILAKNEEITAANEEITTKNETLAQQQEELLTKSEEIHQQNELLETTNRKITDSINYASKIQRAILGEEQLVESNFKDAFLYLRPKDIVSGDFYWYSECKHPESKQRRKLLIAADCTGHGVPGAFMTVMGSSILNEIINNNDVTNPKEILHQLDDKVIAATHKQTTNNANGQVQDGMDMQVLLIDSWNAKLYFSGAKNPLYRIRNKEISVYKGSKFPIGSTQFKITKDFGLQEIDMLPGDKFYIASDGYQDQFGGLDGRKFLRKRFRNLLLDISDFSMSEQKAQLEKTFVNWKGKHKQTDDILVIGFEV